MDKSVALVTGGTGELGTAICRRLCRDGFRVIATYSSPARQIMAAQWQAEQAEMGYAIDIVMMNVASFEDCAIAAREVHARFGPVSVLVNNAAILREAVLKKMQPQQWNAVIHTNLDGVFNVTRQFVDDMMDQGFGRIVNLSCINAHRGQFGQVNYAAAKAGIHGFTKALAFEVARRGVTVNTVSPGYIETGLFDSIPGEMRERMREEIPVGRFGEPADIARAVSFLVAQDAGFITGSELVVNGGHYMA